ncbi:protein of unknown function [Humidesulfovibrio mexicanus]|uniref:Uncharacterized protein n=1 Tax=Humidesulfovibrio mexicanus TaxID=147047 RepID=A0A239AZL5_9BACT|nr:DUF1833 family protein [Humidesulfovibrio mexicanus]SNS00438.1 protein of unknown function [Humidesulfovibrio mexicanus]
MSLSPEGIKAVLAQHTDEVFLNCLRISHPNLTDDIRLVCSKRNLTHAGKEYIAYAFTVRLPNDSEEGVAQFAVELDNTDRRIVEAARSMAGGQPATAVFFAVLASDPESVEVGPYEATMREISYDFQKVTAACNFEDHLNQAYPAHSFTPNRFPGLF